MFKSALGLAVSACNAEPPLELLAARAADTKARAALELDLVVASGTAMKGVDEIHPHDDRAMDAEEPIGVELLLECVNRLANEIRALAGVQLDVRTARGDVLDLRDRNHTHLATHLD